MERDLITFFLANNADRFEPTALMSIRGQLEKASDQTVTALASISYTDPTLILVIAIILGWDRLFLGDVGLGILKILTCYGLGIWWIIDIFTAISRTKEYNYRKFQAAAVILK